MADVDEALVEECADVWVDNNGEAGGLERGFRAVLAHLAATSRLVGEGEERVEWGYLPVGQTEHLAYSTSEQMERAIRRYTASKPEGSRATRTVRTWTTPDGATGTLVGPWVEVEG